VLLKEPEYCSNCSSEVEGMECTYTFQIRFCPNDDYHVIKTDDACDFVCLHSFLMGGIGYHVCKTDEMLHDKIDTICKMTGLGAETVKCWSSKRRIKTPEWEG
jgi:hypothetical protein